jgi:hypothetical protein
VRFSVCRLTTVLTTTTTGNLPVRPPMQIDQCQVSHGMPRPARSLQAEDHRLALAGFWPDNSAQRCHVLRIVEQHLARSPRISAGRGCGRISLRIRCF